MPGSKPREEVVSIRAPARGATQFICRYINTGRFQFALPRGERPSSHQYSDAVPSVSIRAPARGATRAQWHLHQRRGVSIRAPARGATQAKALGYTGAPFQFALPRGERHVFFRTPLGAVMFQFALPRGERHSKYLYSSGALSFNSRSREGSDTTVHPLPLRPVKFQFALPRGERLTQDDND